MPEECLRKRSQKSSTMVQSNRVWKSVSDTDRRMERLELPEVSAMVTIMESGEMPEQDCRSVDGLATQ